MSTNLKVASATLLFAVLHSALATRKAKDLTAHWIGEKNRNAWYRVLYNFQALVTFAVFLKYSSRLPKESLYKIGKPYSYLFYLGQASGYLYLLAAASQVGLLQLSGLRNLMKWKLGLHVSEGPAAQGPENWKGQLTATGPFRLSRHPLNLAPLPVMWLTPHLTQKRLVFNIIGTLYLIAGSWHEEQRLKAQYGKAYEDYQNSGTPFYRPRLRPRIVAGHNSSILP